MKTVKVAITGQNKASRLELFIRIVWFIVSAVVLWAFGIIMVICLVIQWFYILITGKRHKSLNDIIKSYIYYRTKMEAYGYLTTEERNPIFPED